MSDGSTQKQEVQGALHRIGSGEIEVARLEDVELFTLRGQCDAEVWRVLDGLLQRCPRDAGLDLREVKNLGPGMLPLLRKLNKRFQDKRRVMLLFEPPGRLLDLLELTGARNDFDIYRQGDLQKRDRAEAERSLPPPGLDKVASSSSTIARFSHDLARTQRLESSLEIAGLRTGRMLQKWTPRFDPYEISTHYLPHDKVGGDFFQVLPLDDEHLGVAIGDVSGHGLEAALLMGMVRKVLEIRAMDGSREDPGAVLAQVNADLFADLDRFTFITAFYGILERATGRFRYGRAGHNYPLWLAPGQGQARELSGSGIAFGIDSGAMFRQTLKVQELVLAPGEALILYTDGITEAAHPRRGQYGLERLLLFLEKMPPTHTADDLQRSILDELQAFLEGEELHDDQSLICVRRPPNAP